MVHYAKPVCSPKTVTIQTVALQMSQDANFLPNVHVHLLPLPPFFSRMPFPSQPSVFIRAWDRQ